MLFWIIACLIVALVAATLVPSLLRPDTGPAAPSADIAVYRDQLAEVDRDLARGVLDQSEAERTRTEISRRLLSADKAGNAPLVQNPSGPSRVMAGLTVAGLAMMGLGLYAWLGAPGYPDISRAGRIAAGDALRAGRISQAAAEALVPVTQATDVPAADMALIDQLREAVKTHPHRLKAGAFWPSLKPGSATTPPPPGRRNS